MGWDIDFAMYCLYFNYIQNFDMHWIFNNKKNVLLISFTFKINQYSNKTTYNFLRIIIEYCETVSPKQIYTVFNDICIKMME